MGRSIKQTKTKSKLNTKNPYLDANILEVQWAVLDDMPKKQYKSWVMKIPALNIYGTLEKIKSQYYFTQEHNSFELMDCKDLKQAKIQCITCLKNKYIQLSQVFQTYATKFTELDWEQY